MEAMNDYKNGIETNNDQLIQRINDATRCFDLSSLPTLARTQEGKQAAILLKEVLDRVIIINLSLIPDNTELPKWRLKDTEITIAKIEKGPHAHQYLFTTDTTLRAKEFYNKIKHLPYLKGTTQGALFTQGWKDKLPSWSTQKSLGLENWKWLGLFVSLLLGFIVKSFAEFLFLIFKKWILRREDSIRYKLILSLEKPLGLLGATAVWFLCIYHLNLDGLLRSFLLIMIQFTFSISLVWAAYRLTDIFTELFKRFAKKTESELDDHLVPLIAKSMRFFVALIGGLMAIQNLGFNVMSILAGLGIGGLAFALAAKDTAANLFGSIMIFMDQPFKIGDWVVTSDAEGTVEEIGFRSTRIRTFYNSIISIPNSLLANKNIDNMGQRRYRRIRTHIGLTYDTTPEQMQTFIQGIKDIIQEHPHTRKDIYHVVFNEYGDSSLNILLYAFLEVPNWGMELTERQSIFLEIMKLAKRVDVEFAFPTQTLHVASLPLYDKDPSSKPTQQAQ